MVPTADPGLGQVPGAAAVTTETGPGAGSGDRTRDVPGVELREPAVSASL